MKLDILTPILLASTFAVALSHEKGDFSTKVTLGDKKPQQKKGLRKNRNVEHDLEARRRRFRDLRDASANENEDHISQTHEVHVRIPDAATVMSSDQAQVDEKMTSAGSDRALSSSDTRFSHDHGQAKNNNYSSRIVGGEEADPREYPYYVDMFGCGGSLIAPRVVLSAAHCGNYEGYDVIVGGYRAGTTDEGADSITVESQAVHPDYSWDTDGNDFTLLLLAEDANFGFETNVILLLDDSGFVDSLTQGDPLTVVGLGTTSSGGSTADTLREVVVPYVDDDNCRASYASDFDSASMHCAGTGGKDSCQGDSGGPIVVIDGDNHIQTGVVSWGIGCAEPGYPGVYAKVSSAESWIKDTVCDEWGVPASFCDSLGNPTQPTQPPTNPNPTQDGCFRLDFEFHTDDWPEENDFFFIDSYDNFLWQEHGFSANTLYEYTQECLDINSCYVLDIYDTYGDGLVDEGYIRLLINGEEVHHMTSEVGRGAVFYIGNGCNNPESS